LDLRGGERRGTRIESGAIEKGNKQGLGTMSFIHKRGKRVLVLWEALMISEPEKAGPRDPNLRCLYLTKRRARRKGDQNGIQL